MEYNRTYKIQLIRKLFFNKLSVSCIFLFYNIAFAQSLPYLKLKNAIDSNFQIKPPIILKNNDICVTLVSSGGMTAYMQYTHYVFYEDGLVKAFREEIPKSYLKNRNLKKKFSTLTVDAESQQKLTALLISKTNLEFAGFTQNVFYKEKNNSKKIPSPCADDATGYTLSYIQNNKQTALSFYAPESYLINQCKNENINKVVLGKFVNLLQLWGIMER